MYLKIKRILYILKQFNSKIQTEVYLSRHVIFLKSLSAYGTFYSVQRTCVFYKICTETVKTKERGDT